MEELPVPTIFYIMVAIQVIAIIVFFVMAYNISVIKKRLGVKDFDDYWEMAKIEAYIGNKEEARKNYLRARYMRTNKGFAPISFEQIDQAIAELDEKQTQ